MYSRFGHWWMILTGIMDGLNGLGVIWSTDVKLWGHIGVLIWYFADRDWEGFSTVGRCGQLRGDVWRVWWLSCLLEEIVLSVQ